MTASFVIEYFIDQGNFPREIEQLARVVNTLISRKSGNAIIDVTYTGFIQYFKSLEDLKNYATLIQTILSSLDMSKTLQLREKMGCLIEDAKIKVILRKAPPNFNSSTIFPYFENVTKNFISHVKFTHLSDRDLLIETTRDLCASFLNQLCQFLSLSAEKRVQHFYQH